MIVLGVGRMNGVLVGVCWLNMCFGVWLDIFWHGLCFAVGCRRSVFGCMAGRFRVLVEFCGLV